MSQVGDLKWLSVWCRQFSVDFGNLIFPADLVSRDKSFFQYFHLLFQFPKSDDLPHPLVPVDNDVAPEPEPEAEAEPEPEHDHDHHDHDHDHDHSEFEIDSNVHF